MISTAHMTASIPTTTSSGASGSASDGFWGSTDGTGVVTDVTLRGRQP